MKWYRAIFYLAAIFSGLSDACGQNLVEEVRLWDRAEAGKDKRYMSKLFVYEPVAATTSMPAIIVLPGGSYTYLAINSEGHDVATFFASKGYVAVVLRYRMGFFGARYPQHIEDYRKAVDYLRTNAERLCIDTSRIGVAGFSAGGHLAGCAAMEQSPRYRAVFAAMIYPVVTMEEPLCHGPSKYHLLRRKDDLASQLSLEQRVTQDWPPVFLLHCQDDPVVKYQGSEILASELEKKGVNCKVELHLRGGHGFGVRAPSYSGALGWQDRFLQWLERTVFE